jgi:hypothetical protein
LERALLAQGARSASLEDPGFADTTLAFLQDQFFLVDLPADWTAQQVNEWLETSAANDPSPPKSSGRPEAGAEPGTASGASAEVAPQRSSNRSHLRWVGMETERGWLWLHLELTPPTASDSGKSRWLAHRIFLDSIDRQENSVRIVQGSHRSALQFQKNAPARPMPKIAP